MAKGQTGQLSPLVPPYRSQVYPPHIPSQQFLNMYSNTPLSSRQDYFPTVNLTRTENVHNTIRSQESIENDHSSPSIFNIPNTVHQEHKEQDAPHPFSSFQQFI